MKSALTLWANLDAARDDSSMNLIMLKYAVKYCVKYVCFVNGGNKRVNMCVKGN